MPAPQRNALFSQKSFAVGTTKLMPSSDLERFATLIADNVVSAFERDRDGSEFHRTGRQTAVSVLVHDILAALPTTSGDVLTAAGNRGLDDVGADRPWQSSGRGGRSLRRVGVDAAGVDRRRLDR